MKQITKDIENGKVKVSYNKAGKHHMVFVNLGRSNKGKGVNTSTYYDSIQEGEKPYCHVWIDKVGKKVVGVEVVWE